MITSTNDAVIISIFIVACFCKLHLFLSAAVALTVKLSKSKLNRKRMLSFIDFNSFTLLSYKYTWFLINRHLLKQDYMHVITLNISNLLKKSKHIMKQYLGGSGGGGGSVCVFVFAFISFHCKDFSWLNKTINVMPEIRLAMSCWGNTSVSKTFIVMS